MGLWDSLNGMNCGGALYVPKRPGIGATDLCKGKHGPLNKGLRMQEYPLIR